MKTKRILKSSILISSLFLTLSGISQNTLPSTGNVGVGTTSPAYPIEVVGPPGTIGSFKSTNGTLTESSGIIFQNGRTFVGFDAIYGSAKLAVADPSKSIIFGNSTTLGAGELMRLDGSGRLGIGTSKPGFLLDMDTKSEWNNSSYIRLMGSAYQPGLYNLTISKFNSLKAGNDHPTFDYNFDHYQFGGINGTQLSLKYNGDVGVGGALTFQDANGYLIGGSIRPSIDGLVTNGGNKHIIIAGQEVRINAPLLLAKKVKVSINSTDWADYVFDKSYNLRPLASVENFINKYKHLPDVPSAQEVGKNDLDVGAAQATLLKKIEELTLYMIGQDKVIKNQQKLIAQIIKEVNKTKNNK